MRTKQSVVWWTFAERYRGRPEQLIREIAEIGYDAIEHIDQSFWPLVQAHGLAISSIIGHRSLADGLNKYENHSRIEQELMANIKLAEQWNIPNIVCFSGKRYHLNEYTAAEATAEGLRRVARAAEEAGVNLILELINSKIDHPGYQCDHTTWGISVCDMVASPRVKLLYDIYHMQIMEGDIIRTIRTNHPYFAHYHTAGNPGRHDLDSTQELYYPAILQTLLTIGYNGYVGHEFFPRGDVKEALQNAFSLCNVLA